MYRWILQTTAYVDFMQKYSLSFLLKSDRLYLYQKPSICKIYGARIAVRIPLRISPRLA